MKGMKLTVLLAILVSAVGCSLDAGSVKTREFPSGSDVFTEVGADAVAPKGCAILHITSSLKTLLPGEGGGLVQLIDVDGQTLRLTDKGKEEDRELGGLMDPEAGRGFRHIFSATLLLKAGPHRVSVGFPDKELTVAKNIVLTGGTVNILQVEPQYRTLPASRGIPYTGTGFKEGILSLDAKLNGNPL